MFSVGYEVEWRVDQAVSHTPGNRKRAQRKQGVKIHPLVNIKLEFEIQQGSIPGPVLFCFHVLLQAIIGNVGHLYADDI